MRSRRAAITLGGLLTAVAAAVLGATPALAHGERAQDGFARMETVGWWDTKFNDQQPQDPAVTIQQGQKFTITGTAKVLTVYPNTLSGGNPDVCYFTAVVPGAQFVMLDKTINGVEAPQSFFCHKGGVYNYTETLQARAPGTWHVHPALAIRESGTIIGPGQWFTVTPSPNGFTLPVQLLNGGTVNLDTIGLPLVAIVSIIGFILGIWWMIYWTWSKPTITRLAAANMMPLNQDGGDAVGLITRKDHRQSALIAIVTVVFVLVIFGYQAIAYPSKLPQQTDWFLPPNPPAVPQIGTTTVTGSTYNIGTHVTTFAVTVHNTSSEPIQLGAYHTAYLTFFNPSAQTLSSSSYVNPMQVSPDAPIAPGQTQDLTITIPATGNIFDREQLLPIGHAELEMAGVLELDGQSGARNFQEFVTPLVPNRV